VQHFIRRATFTTDTPDFGFLVPTPTQPTLAEAKDEAFSFLEKLMAPKVVKVTQYEVGLFLGASGNKVAALPGNNADVRILEETRLAGYDAVVLEADNATALNKWLTKHEYISRPDLTAWLEPYVKAHWKITAFKIARDASRQAVATSAVRMSFSAERPFFPYSEPADRHAGAGQGSSRLLRVFFVADRRYQGTLGDGEHWPGETVWAGPLQTATAQTLSSSLNLTVPLEPVWLTTFEDRSSPRPGTADVYFSPSADQHEVHPPPIQVIEVVDLSGWVCLGVVVLLFLVSALLGFRMARRKAPQGF
jgi:hypothetical protein